MHTMDTAVHTKIAYSTRSTNSVNIFFNITRQVEVNNVFYVGNVETSCRHLTHQCQQQSKLTTQIMVIFGKVADCKQNM